MNILVTGAKGMVGTALCNNLKNIRDGKNRTRPNIKIDQIFEYDLGDEAKLDEYCKEADFVFNLAGVNRPENPEDFMKGNFGFASTLLDTLKKYNNKAPIMLSSSIQATLAGRFGNSEYGRSKKAGEELFFDYAKETGAKVAVYRFVNLMGHSRPKYNSAVSTFCWAVANDEEFTVNDRSTELELLYIDDLVEGMYDLLEGKEQHCEFDGVNAVADEGGRYCYIPTTHKVTLGEIVDLLQEFKQQPTTLMMPKMPDGSFAKKLYSLYLSYLPTDKFKYPLKMNVDQRGSFTELVHTEDCGQVYDIMCPTRYHVDRFDLVTANIEFDHLAGRDVPFLNQSVALHNDEELPFGIMPMLAFGDARFADVDGNLPAVFGMHKLGKAAALIDIHLQRILEFVCRQVAQIPFKKPSKD